MKFSDLFFFGTKKTQDALWFGEDYGSVNARVTNAPGPERIVSSYKLGNSKRYKNFELPYSASNKFDYKTISVMFLLAWQMTLKKKTYPQLAKSPRKMHKIINKQNKVEQSLFTKEYRYCTFGPETHVLFLSLIPRLSLYHSAKNDMSCTVLWF